MVTWPCIVAPMRHLGANYTWLRMENSTREEPKEVGGLCSSHGKCVWTMFTPKNRRVVTHGLFQIWPYSMSVWF